MSKQSNVQCWTLYTDGASCPTTKHAAIGFVIYKPVQEKPVASVGRTIDYVTSHSAEFTAIIHGLKEAYQRGARVIAVRSDAENVVKQLNGECRVKAAHLKPLLEETLKQIERFSQVTVTHIGRTENIVAHKLASSQKAKFTAAVSSPEAIAPPHKVNAPTILVALQPSSPSQQFWKPVGNDMCFWNLAKLWSIADKMPIETIAIGDLQAHLDTPGWFGDEPLTLRRVAELASQTVSADADKPLLVCDVDLLDGRFRLAKALCGGKQEVLLKRLKHLPKPDARYPLRYAP